MYLMGFPKMRLPKFSSRGWGHAGPQCGSYVAAMWDAENYWDHITYSTYIIIAPYIIHIYIHKDVIQPKKKFEMEFKKSGDGLFFILSDVSSLQWMGHHMCTVSFADQFFVGMNILASLIFLV